MCYIHLTPLSSLRVEGSLGTRLVTLWMFPSLPPQKETVLVVSREFGPRNFGSLDQDFC